MKNLYLPLLFIFSLASAAYGQQPGADSLKKLLPPVKKFYIGTGMDGAILSTATVQHTSPGPNPTTTNSIGMIRFSLIVNAGITFNFNFGRHVGIYTGVDVKNIGYIETISGFTYKRRVYTLGAPLGIKIGNMVARRSYMFLGGGADCPFNYKEKKFQIRDQKTKTDEWFSNRTPAVMPYAFVGLAINHGYSLKLQYYPDNFMNPDFRDKSGAQPYLGTEVHLILLTLGFAIPMRQHDMVEKNITRLNTM